MAKNPVGKSIVSAVRETLDSVVTPSVRDTILARALADARKKEVPTEPTELDEFVQGPLHDSLVRSLGPELGMSVATELERIVTLAAKDAEARSSRRPVSLQPAHLSQELPPTKPQPVKRRASRSTMPSRGTMPAANPAGSGRAMDEHWLEQQRRGIAPTMPAARRVGTAEVSLSSQGRAISSLTSSPTSDDFPAGTAQALGVIGTLSIDPRPLLRPVVFVASTDGELLRSFQGWLDARATVEVVASAALLLRRIEDIGTLRSVVVLDGKHPSIRPLTLAALADELASNTKVLLWGVPSHMHARMCTVASAAERWLVAAGDATSEEIVARCAKLVG